MQSAVNSYKHILPVLYSAMLIASDPSRTLVSSVLLFPLLIFNFLFLAWLSFVYHYNSFLGLVTYLISHVLLVLLLTALVLLEMMWAFFYTSLVLLDI